MANSESEDARRSGSTRERIVRTTIELIERDGLQQLTMRGLAEEAGVNIAAVNYHFGSKEALLEVAMEQTLREGTSKLLAELDQAIEATGSVARGVRLIVNHLVTGALNYPRIAQWQLHDAMAHGDYTGRAVSEMTVFLDGFLDRAGSLMPPGDRQEQRASLAQMWSALLFVAMMPGIWSGFLGHDMRDRPEEFAERLLRTHLPGALEE